MGTPNFEKGRWLILPLVCLASLFYFFKVDGEAWRDLPLPSSIAQPAPLSLDTLWPTVPWPNNGQDPSSETWGYVHTRNKEGHLGKQRASWGGLRQQGAKAHLKDSLRDDKRYVFSEAVWGWNNQVLEMINLIYLGHLTNRIPILFEFEGNTGHFDGKERLIRLPVSEVFDLSALAGILDVPIIESHEVKHVENMSDSQRPAVYDGEIPQYDSSAEPLQIGSKLYPEPPADESLGCYSYNLLSKKNESGRMYTMKGLHYELVALPPRVCYRDNCDRSSILELAEIIEQDPEAIVAEHVAQGHLKPGILPDPKVACVDMMFYFMTHPSRMWSIIKEVEDGYGLWAIVGKHLRYQPGLVSLAQDYLRHKMELPSGEDVPPYLAVHIRRTDLLILYPGFADKSAIEWLYAAWLLMEDIKAYQGIAIRHVVFTTDETDVEWLAPLIEAGWYHMDHTATDTAARLGSQWFPLLLDSIILSGGHGFLGMDGSTMSGLAYRRVIDWQGGIGRFVQEHQPVPDGWKVTPGKRGLLLDRLAKKSTWQITV